MTKKPVDVETSGSPAIPPLTSGSVMAPGMLPQNNNLSSMQHQKEDVIRREFADPDMDVEKQYEIFLRGIVHDVNNGLMAILSACDQMDYRSGVTDIQDASDTIRTHVKSISCLMRDLLSNQNMDAPVCMDEHELKSFLKGILPSLSLVAGQGTRIELGDFSIPPVMVHPMLLHRVLLQFIRNVSELDLDHPLAFITARRYNEWCEISVSDNGPGIKENVFKHLFEPGFTTKGKEGARGYGLSAVAWAVKNWGGEYGVDHIDGNGGCRFWVRLPLS